MAVQDTVGTVAGVERAPPAAAAGERSARPARRLPVQKDWPTWALVATQIGILVVSTLTTYAGVKALDLDGERLFYSLGATRMQVFRKLVVPFCLPWIISVLRVNIGLALTGAIVGEFIASQHGLGRAILYAGQTYDIALVWVAVLVLSTLAMVMYATVSWVESMLRKGVRQ